MLVDGPQPQHIIRSQLLEAKPPPGLTSSAAMTASMSSESSSQEGCPSACDTLQSMHSTQLNVALPPHPPSRLCKLTNRRHSTSQVRHSCESFKRTKALLCSQQGLWVGLLPEVPAAVSAMCLSMLGAR